LKKAILKDAQRAAAKRSLLDFICYVWDRPEPFIVGQHTIAICEAIDKAVEAYERGESAFYRIMVPYRHGKSLIASLMFPAYFLGRCAGRNPDLILSGYGFQLVESFSKDVQRILNSPAYQEVFPGVFPARGSSSSNRWQVEGSTGRVVAQGLGGAITGSGGDAIVVDDFIKSRSEARSETFRRNIWECFQNDIMTRRAPASIVLVVATPWHIADLHGMIAAQMEKDPNFPRFETLRFGATAPDGSRLFPERFSEQWYLEQYATLGKFASAMLDCNPVQEGGNRFQCEIGKNIHIHDSLADFPQGRYVRAWDLASSSKERDKDDPDETVGLLGTVTTDYQDIGGGARVKRQSLWIKDCVACHSEAPARNALIQRTAAKDGQSGIPQYIEAFGAYKDAYTTLRDLLKGICVVRQSRLPGDKSAKASPLEPIFEAGNVHIMRGAWNKAFIDQFRAFPDGAHDDYVDPAAIVFDAFKVRSGVVDPNA